VERRRWTPLWILFSAGGRKGKQDSETGKVKGTAVRRESEGDQPGKGGRGVERREGEGLREEKERV
jgi:hypothetical protein